MGRKTTGKTAKRLLNAAAEVFAERDYRSATVSEICRLAGTNISAVNYHFRDKETSTQKPGVMPSQSQSRLTPPVRQKAG